MQQENRAKTLSRNEITARCMRVRYATRKEKGIELIKTRNKNPFGPQIIKKEQGEENSTNKNNQRSYSRLRCFEKTTPYKYRLPMKNYGTFYQATNMDKK